ncbi:hypothetical protein DL96DRAFT_1593797 [Flagelloscypha sp. PMI_526]|nr:hypothetical protein DL96DRAFT_1593797 [Flagelloscypha sp. PMI_526]
MYRSASPYGAASPLPQVGDPNAGVYAHQQAPPVAASPYQPFGTIPPAQPAQQTPIAPGAITYTTSQSPDGRVVYQPFKAVQASYQTPNGIVHGIQWVPIEATNVVPTGAQPASADFAAMWQRGNPNMTPQDEQNIKDWQKREEKARRREERESRKMREKESLYNSPTSEDAELRRARERDAKKAADRERRRSVNASPYGAPTGLPSTSPVPGAYPPTSPYVPPGTIPTSPYGQPATSPYPPSGTTATNPYAFAGDPGSALPAGYPQSTARGGHSLNEIDSHLNNLDLSASGEFEREKSRPKKFQTSETMAQRARRLSGNFSPPTAAAAAPAGPYSSFNSAVSGGYPTAPTAGGYPPAAAGGYPPATTPSATYAPFQPQPTATSIADSQARSRATTPAVGHSPLPGAYPPMIMPSVSAEPDGEAKQLPTPEGFSRPPNQSQSFTPFEPMKIQDMDEFFEVIPRMPLVLQTHDTFHEDWIRVMQDVSLAWAGQLPVPHLNKGGRYPKRSTLTADLIELWNTHFFNCRGVDMVLYKGRERRSGPSTGVVDLQFADDDSDESSSTTSTSESDEVSPGRYGATGGAYGAYGRQPAHGPNQESLEARRRRRERKSERKRRHREKRAEKRRRRREKTYALYLTYVPPTQSQLTQNAIPAPGAVAGFGVPAYGVSQGY